MHIGRKSGRRHQAKPSADVVVFHRIANGRDSGCFTSALAGCHAKSTHTSTIHLRNCIAYVSKSELQLTA